MEKDIAINVTGGTGKQISLTHILPELKEVYDHVYIRSPYTDVFESSPYVDYVYKIHEAQAFFFDNKDAKIVIDDMYHMEGFIKKQLSYADAWRIMCGLEPKGDVDGMDVVAHIDPAKKFPELVNKAEQAKQHIGNKRFVIMQFAGGQSPLVQVPRNEKGEEDWSKVPYMYDNEPLRRHYPTDKATEFVQLFKEAHPDVAIILYSLPNEPYIEGTERFILPYLTYHILAKDERCDGIVTIDSSLQHLTAGVCKTVVVWGHSHPHSFGYKYNHNILQKCDRSGILYFTDLGPGTSRVDYIAPEKLLDEVNSYLYGIEKA